MIYYSVKFHGKLIKPIISEDNAIEHFAWCVARVVEELNYEQTEPKRTISALESLSSDMQKNQDTAQLFNEKYIEFHKKIVHPGKLTASLLGGFIIKLAKQLDCECYLGKKPPSEENKEENMGEQHLSPSVS